MGRHLGRLPVAAGERDLDARAVRVGGVEVVEERLVVRGPRGWVLERLAQVAHRRRPLPYREREQQPDRGEPEPAATPEQRAGHDRPADERAEPHRVAAHRRVDEERRRARERVQERPDPKRALAARQEIGACDREDRDGQVGGPREGLPAARGEHEREQHDRGEGGRHDRGAGPHASGQRVRRRRERQEGARDGAR